MSAGDGESVQISADDWCGPSVEFDTRTDSYRCELGGDGQLASEAVVAVVAHASGCDPMMLSPLYGSIDPDALDSIFAETITGTRPTTVSVTFEYADHVVSVHGDGIVVLSEPE